MFNHVVLLVQCGLKGLHKNGRPSVSSSFGVLHPQVEIIIVSGSLPLAKQSRSAIPTEMTTPPLDLFIVFARVAEAGGFTAAAQQLDVSKATVSKGITELERQLGVSLLRRTTRRLSLTEAGERILARAQRILEEAEAAVEEASDAKASARGRLKVSVPMSWGIRYLAPKLPDFLLAFPDIQVDLSFEDRAVDLVGESFDLAVRIREMEDSSLLSRQLAPVQRLVVGAPAYFKANGRPAHPGDLGAHACLHYSNLSSGAIWKFAGPRGEKASVRVNGPLCVNNGDAIQIAVLAGRGLALQPDFLVWEDVDAGRTEICLPDWKAPELKLHVLTAPGRQLPRKVRVFSDFLHDNWAAGRAPWLR
jgi:DNA-binding transcriptional LysR family regulator